MKLINFPNCKAVLEGKDKQRGPGDLYDTRRWYSWEIPPSLQDILSPQGPGWPSVPHSGKMSRILIGSSCQKSKQVGRFSRIWYLYNTLEKAGKAVTAGMCLMPIKLHTHGSAMVKQRPPSLPACKNASHCKVMYNWYANVGRTQWKLPQRKRTAAPAKPAKLF